HSHPSSENFPSHRDVEMAFYPDCVHFIISPVVPFERRVRAFSIEDCQVAELSVVSC
ncbi:MAG: Mov34/MPN/PAD-1 family protein, partial [Terriglobia bacterium]